MNRLTQYCPKQRSRVSLLKILPGGASGISVMQRVANNTAGFKDNNNVIVSSAYIKEKYKNHSVIFEKQIIQHSEMAKFNPDTVNTIRVLTYKNKIIAATARFGGKGCFVDNLAKGGLAVNVDLESGRMGEWGMRKYGFEHCVEHPDTQEKFSGQVVPMWDEAKAIVECCMRYLPYYGSVGFDVAISKDGPLIVEINTGVGIYASQIAMEYGLANKFK